MNPPVWQSLTDLSIEDTVFISHEIFCDHVSNPEHPECVERMKAVWQALANLKSQKIKHVRACLAEDFDVCKIHPSGYVLWLKKQLPAWGLAFLDADTYLTPESYDVALYAVGAGVLATQLILERKAKNAFCAVRPPGHHASTNKAEGFCLLNNVAVAANYALNQNNLNRVAIIDIDVHHGNGTQNIFWDNPDVLFISLHQNQGWPFTGISSETGAHNNVLNIPLPLGTHGPDYLGTFSTQALSKVYDFKPDMLFVSAGFDAHKDDPLGQLSLVSQDYFELTKLIKQAAKDLCHNRLVMMLEGGYNLTALEESVAHTLRALSI